MVPVSSKNFIDFNAVLVFEVCVNNENASERHPCVCHGIHYCIDLQNWHNLP